MDTINVAHYTLQNSGGTFYHSLGTISLASVPDNPVRAWTVAVDAPSTVTDVDALQRSTGFAPIEIMTGAIWDFIRLHHNGEHMFGTWVKDGKLYIDHVIMTTLEHAISIARERGELAIYNLATGATHTL